MPRIYLGRTYSPTDWCIIPCGANRISNYDLVCRQVAALFVASNAGALAAKQATRTIPIVFSAGDDPVASGLVPSLNRPSGNLTGIYQFSGGPEAKRLGLLHEMVPKATIIGVLVNPNYSGAEDQLCEVQQAAASLGVQLAVVRANVESDFDAAFSCPTAGHGTPGLRLSILQHQAPAARRADRTPCIALRILTRTGLRLVGGL